MKGTLDNYSQFNVTLSSQTALLASSSVIKSGRSFGADGDEDDSDDIFYTAKNGKENRDSIPLHSSSSRLTFPSSLLPPGSPLSKQFCSPLRGSQSTPPSAKGHREQLLRVISSPSFLSDYDKVQELNPDDLVVGKCIVRKKSERKLLHGYECPCCTHYYDALDLDPLERQRRIDQVSKHRYMKDIPKTPENYWEVKMACREEQIRRGQIVESNSPLGLKPRNSLYAQKSLRRRLF